MSDFLLELRCEEIPARMQAGARADLEKLFRQQMADAGIEAGDVTVWSTPRRLALIGRDLPEATGAVSEEVKGPPEGAPDAAIDGFCRKNGVTRDQLTLREVKGRNTWFAVIEKPGRTVSEVLAEAIPAIVRAFPWPKSMRWGAASISTESLRWVRPLSGIVAILGEELVEVEIDGTGGLPEKVGTGFSSGNPTAKLRSGYATRGHRFHHPGDITIGGAHDYADKLRACHVIVDHEERQDLIRTRAAEAARAEGLELVEDEGLVVENAGLTEWPVPLLGRFDEAFLEVPPEVIQLTARINQKYFVCEQGGKLANAFVCTANIEAADGGEAIVVGNCKVLAARLSDARFFWTAGRRWRNMPRV
jgi:glycyl-tRNA synthetase beta chain